MEVAGGWRAAEHARGAAVQRRGGGAPLGAAARGLVVELHRDVAQCDPARQPVHRARAAREQRARRLRAAAREREQQGRLRAREAVERRL